MNGLREVLMFLSARPIDPPVERLLLDSARPEAVTLERLWTTDPVTWVKVLVLAEAHGTLPGCASLFADASGLPEAVQERLHRVREEAQSLDRLHVMVLADLLGAFAVQGIPVMVLKGARIAEQLYRDPAARIAKDIDLLVRREDLDAAGSVLSGRGFSCHERAYYETHHFHHIWTHRSRTLIRNVELHWDVTRPGSSVRFPLGEWWQAPVSVALRAGRALAPPRADEFAYIAYHAMCRGMPRLRDLGDVAGLWAQASHDERENMMRCARSAGALGYVSSACGLAHAFWGLGNYTFDTGTAHPFIARHVYAPRRVLASPDRIWWAVEELGARSLEDSTRVGARQLISSGVPDGERSPWTHRETAPPHWKVAAAMLGAIIAVGLAAALRRF